MIRPIHTPDQSPTGLPARDRAVPNEQPDAEDFRSLFLRALAAPAAESEARLGKQMEHLQSLVEQLLQRQQNGRRLAVEFDEAARMLSVSPTTLYRLVKRGLIRPVKATRKPVFAVAELERFLEETSSSISL